MKVIAIANQKGGIGKTTTAQALIELMRDEGKKVLGIDLDTQGNLTDFMGMDANPKKVSDLLKGESPEDIISHDFIAGDYMTMQEAKKTTPKRVADALAKAVNGYEYCVIDTPVTIDTITLGALLVSDIVIIPTTADGGALKGIEALSGAIETAKKVNKRLKGVWVLFVRYDKRKVLDRQLREAFEQRTPYKCFKTAIRQANPIREAQTMQEPLMSAKHSTAMRDYRAVLNEMEKGE